MVRGARIARCSLWASVWSGLWVQSGPRLSSGKLFRCGGDRGGPRLEASPTSSYRSMLGVVERFLSSVDRTIDMPNGTIAQTLGQRVVLFPGNVTVCLAQQLQSFVQPPRMVRWYIHLRVIMDIFAIIDGRALDLADRAVNFGYGDILLTADCGIPGAMLQHPARRAQICQRVQIVRMLTGQIRARSKRQRCKQHTNHQRSLQTLHANPPPRMRDQSRPSKRAGT